MHKTPNTSLNPSAVMGMENSTFPQRLRPSAKTPAELGQAEALITEKLAKARG